MSTDITIRLYNTLLFLRFNTFNHKLQIGNNEK